MTTNNKDIPKFYDALNVENYKKFGINIRHRTIFKNLKTAGLLPSHNVLEIGCGTGPVTSLIAKYCNKGKIVAADISPESIEYAKNYLKRFSNIHFLVSDMSDFKYEMKFDFIVLPDVLEHIPVEQHRNLFYTIRQHCHINSIVFINIPAPHYLRWMYKYKPELIQIIDQPLSMQDLLNDVYPNGFYLFSSGIYNLAINEGDYQQIIMKPDKNMETVTYKSKKDLIIQEIKSKLFY